MSQQRAVGRSRSSERLLLQELTHRVSNEFAAVIALISAARLAVEDAEAASVLTHTKCCLQNFARLHRILRLPELKTEVDGASYLHELCEAISVSRLQDRGIVLRFEKQAFRIDSEQCWQLGMIVAELISNSATHAFCDGPGMIAVDASRAGIYVQCRVKDNGRSAGPIRRGCGLSVLSALTQDLGGTISQEFGTNGTATLVVFPAELTKGSRQR